MNTNSQHDSFLLQFPVFEIQNHADTQIRDPQIIQYQSTFVVCDSVDDFCVDDPESLRGCRNGISRNTKLHDECIFIGLFNNTVTERVEYLDCTSNDLKDFVF